MERLGDLDDWEMYRVARAPGDPGARTVALRAHPEMGQTAVLRWSAHAVEPVSGVTEAMSPEKGAPDRRRILKRSPGTRAQAPRTEPANGGMTAAVGG